MSKFDLIQCRRTKMEKGINIIGINNASSHNADSD